MFYKNSLILYPFLCSLLSFHFKRKKLGSLCLSFSLLNLYLFRNPKREPVFNPELIISPADGKVILCKIEEDRKLYPEPLWKIKISMRLWDVYTLRSPVTGKILKISHSQNKKENTYLIEREDGQPFWITQISIFRIINFALPGDDIITGETIGMTKFGSKIELLFPMKNAEIYVKEGHRVFGGETVLGRIPFQKNFY